MSPFLKTATTLSPSTTLFALLTDQKTGSDFGETLVQYNYDTRIIVYGNGGHDWIAGGNKNDVLYGGDGSDTIKGGAGNDRIYGDAMPDDIDGGIGADIVTGGSGGDWFRFFSGSSNRYAGEFDTITDFNAAEGDRLILTMKVPDGSSFPTWQNVYAGPWNHMQVETTAKTMEEALKQADSMRPAPSVQVLQLYNPETKTSYLLADLDPQAYARPTFETTIALTGVSGPIPVENIY